MTGTTFTAEELAGLAQFEASLAAATEQQRITTLAALKPGGSVERQKGAPRREVLDEMARLISVSLYPPVAMAPAAPATPAGYTRVKIVASGREFGKAVNWAKGQRGKFDPQTKTWLIPSDSNFLNGPGLYGWQIVK